ncbi:MAG: hypothetical protein LBS60_02215 [Deltaproteobacteria bacterium]|jgi:hypothetical protein|nr:hypothetical protein [Deltaproteobacteria bacterium]
MNASKPKKFNIAGPCVPSDDYMLPALPRLPNVLKLIKSKKYFVLHAPRQSGKTTSIKAAVERINAEGEYYALNCSLEELRMCTDKDEAMSLIVAGLYGALFDSGVKALEKVAVSGFLAEARARADFNSSPVRVCFKVLCKRLDKGLVVFFDEADCLTEQPLWSFLSQLRRGFTERRKSPFPSSIALIGRRNIRDYTAQIRPDSQILGSGSPFNIIVKALTLANFTPEEIEDLYGQHTEATGQVFLDEAVQKAYYWSEGQPWLVNALAREAVGEILDDDYGTAITADLIDEAANNLMKRRDTHIDSLLRLLNEPRVARVIRPTLAYLKSEDPPCEVDDANLGANFFDDYQYCLDLGLIKGDANSYRPANPIYASFMSRYLNRGL